jgi:hypothetical protein
MGLAVLIILSITFMLSGYILKNTAYSLVSTILWLMTLAFAGTNYVWFIDQPTTWVIDSLVFGALAFTSIFESIENRKHNKEQRLLVTIDKKHKRADLIKNGDLNEDGEIPDDEE